MMVAGFFACGMQPVCAESDIDGMDHSKLNHGVLGAAAFQAAHDDHQHATIDADVAGMDHSKLNHGVLGSGMVGRGVLVSEWNSPAR